MTRLSLLLVAAGFVLATVALWAWLRPVVPVDTPNFHWRVANDAYELVVSDISGNPEFRQGVLTGPVPRTGPVRVRGVADPGALVEISNPRTGRAFATRADGTGEFVIEAEARRGDELKVLSRNIQFRMPETPRYSTAPASSP